MASKGKGKGKSSKIEQKGLPKKKQFPQQSQNIADLYEGAIDNSFFFQCIQKSSQKLLKARILGAKLIDNKYPLNEASYEYYVHYEGENRRWDEWVSIEKLQSTDEKIPEEPKKIQKAKAHDFNEYDEHEGFNQDGLNEHLEYTKFKTIKAVKIGNHEIDSWYYSPFPLNYQNIDMLYFCNFCLSFFKKENELIRHKQTCKLNCPPGDEMYRDDSGEVSISMFEVDGRCSPVYVENLSYFSKLFLDHKNLYWNMDSFLFYILCENDSEGSHIVGYFSKEKESKENYNLSCILVFPPHMRKGYGKFLITFSYELSAIEDRVGTPEKPLSDLGRKTYLSWWSQRIISFIENKPENYAFSVEEISRQTYIKEADVLWTLEQKGLVKYSGSTSYLCTDSTYLKKIYKESGSSGVPVYREKIHWVPNKKVQNKGYLGRQPDYDPMKGSNYTNVGLKLQDSFSTSQQAPTKQKKTQSKKNALKQIQQIPLTPSSQNQNSNSISNAMINNNNLNNNTNMINHQEFHSENQQMQQFQMAVQYQMQ